MIVIYTQDDTYIKEDAEDAKDILVSIYGEKFGNEAYIEMKNGRIGSSYRKNGGPLVQFVDCDAAEQIRSKETAIGMMK